MVRRSWFTTTSTVASTILALHHNPNNVVVSGFAPTRSSWSTSTINTANSNIIHQQKKSSFLFSTAVTISEAADEASEIKSMDDGKPNNNDKSSIVPGRILQQSHQVMAIQLLLNEDIPAQKEPTTISDDSTSMFQPVDEQQKKKKQAEGVSDFTGKTVLFKNGDKGIVVAQRPPIAFCLMKKQQDDETPSLVEENDEATAFFQTNKMTISVVDSMIGKVLDCFGDVIEDYSTNNNEDNNEDEKVICDRPIFASIPQLKDIALINEPMLSGTCMIDALAPIGKGQNMLLVGEEGIGERDLLLDMMKMQLELKGKKKIVYALTSTDATVRQNVIQTFQDAGILKDIIVVSMRNNNNNDSSKEGEDIIDVASAAAEAVTVAGTACAIAEAFALSNGEDALVLVDNINSHKDLWDWSTRVLIDVYGVAAVVKDDIEGGASSEMRGFYSALIQRAGKFKETLGGGSVTTTLLSLLPKLSTLTDDENEMIFSDKDFELCSDKIKQRIDILVQNKIPLTAVTLRKIQIPVPVASESEKNRRMAVQHSEELISMTDGQIWLDEALYEEGQRPAMDPQRSLTRIGIGADTESRSDAPAMRSLSGGLRFDFAQASAVDGADVNSGADKQILKKKAYLLAMHQQLNDGRTLSENCVTLLAASIGSLNNVIEQGSTAGTDAGQEAINGLLSHVKKEAPSAMKDIDDTLDMSPSVRKELESLIHSYYSSS